MTQQTTTPNEGAAITPPETQQAQSAVNGGSSEAKFTNAQVEALIQERLAKQAGSERRKIMEKFGIEDEDTDAELLKAAKAKREADKSEIEKAAGLTAKEKERADRLQLELDQERAERLADKRDGKLRDALTAAKIKPDRVAAALKLLALEQADALKAVMKDDGSVDDKAVTKIADDARKAYPEWFSTGGVGSPSNNGGSSRAPQPGADAAKRASQMNQSRIRG